MELWSPGADVVVAALDELDAVWDKLASLPVAALGVLDATEVLDRLETFRRRQPVVEHALLTHLQSQATAREMGAKSWRAVLGERLGISRADAGRRLAEAAALGPRTTVSGQRLEPELPATAAAQARGEIGAEHVSVIRDFVAHLPADVDPDTAAAAEAQLGGLAGGLTPEGLRAVARQLMGYLDQDGTLDNEREHARKRGITLGPQGLDGMSRLTGWVDPALRASLEAILAKLAAPGYANPADEVPCVGGTPTQEQITGDARSGAQRSHDAVAHVCAAMLASKKLGQHNGLPVTVIATTSLAELTAGAGRVRTADGTRLPVPTLIAMAGELHPYLMLMGNPRELQLYYGRTRRTASAAQRLAMIVRDRGCTKPGCTVTATGCQGHHITDWQHGGATDIDELTLACPADNRLVDDTTTPGQPPGWTTRKPGHGNRAEWIPPPHLDRGQNRTNLFHHPEELLRPEDLPRPEELPRPDEPGADDPG